MRASELRELSETELTQREEDLRESLFRFQLRRGTNQLDNPAAMRRARRDLARVYTVQAERRRKVELSTGEGR